MAASSENHWPAFEESLGYYEELVDSVPDFDELGRDDALDLIEQIPERLRAHLLFVAAARENRVGQSRILLKLARERLSVEEVESLAYSWYLFRRSDTAKSWFFDEGFSRMVREKLGRTRTLALLRRIIMESPPDSQAYLDASSELVHRSHTESDITAFRAMWEWLPAERREAIAIHLYPWREDYWQRHEPGSTVIIYNASNRLDLLAGSTPLAAPSLTRPRWIDWELPAVRGLLWEFLTSACRDFSLQFASLGGEREQVGALLQLVKDGFRRASSASEKTVASHGSLDVRRYVFHTREEHIWGPDFALIFLYRQRQELILGRYVLFQAKLIDRAAVRISVQQLSALLRTSWHSSLYIAWGPDVSPRCIPAALLHTMLSAGSDPGRRAVHSPSIRWDTILPFSDAFADLLGDRFLCGELGDPLPPGSGTDASEIAQRLADQVGVPIGGILAFTVTTGMREDDEERRPRITVGEDIPLGEEETL